VGIAQRLAQAPLKAIYSSPLERARETAEPLAQVKKLTVLIRSGLGEVQYGQWTGKSLKALKRTKLWPVVQRHPARMEFPEGETFRAVQARAVDEVEKIAREHPKDLVAAFSHGDVIKLIVAHYLGVPLDLFQRLMVNTGSITVLHLEGSHAALVKLNDTGALKFK